MNNDRNTETKIENILRNKPMLQGWLLIVLSIILFLYTIGYFAFLHFVIIAIAVYLFLKGASQVNLFQKIEDIYLWIKSKISSK